MTKLNVYSKEQMDEKLPEPSVADAGKVLMVGNDGKLTFGEGGGSGSSADALLCKVFTDPLDLYDFLLTTSPENDFVNEIVSVSMFESSDILVNEKRMNEIYTNVDSNDNAVFLFRTSPITSIFSNGNNDCTIEEYSIDLALTIAGFDANETKEYWKEITYTNLDTTPQVAYNSGESTYSLPNDTQFRVIYKVKQPFLKFEIQYTGVML